MTCIHPAFSVLLRLLYRVIWRDLSSDPFPVQIQLAHSVMLPPNTNTLPHHANFSSFPSDDAN